MMIASAPIGFDVDQLENALFRLRRRVVLRQINAVPREVGNLPFLPAPQAVVISTSGSVRHLASNDFSAGEGE